MSSSELAIKFPGSVIVAAQAAQKATGCPAIVALAQWALESNYGHCPCAPNNFFGMKWFNGCKYPFASRFTRECLRDGTWITIEAKFQSFPDLATAFTEHGKLLMNPSGPYRKAVPLAHDWKAFLIAIAPIYATDPDYCNKLVWIIAHYGLDKLN